jgi:hypothetical protein
MQVYKKYLSKNTYNTISKRRSFTEKQKLNKLYEESQKSYINKMEKFYSNVSKNIPMFQAVWTGVRGLSVERIEKLIKQRVIQNPEAASKFIHRIFTEYQKLPTAPPCPSYPKGPNLRGTFMRTKYHAMTTRQNTRRQQQSPQMTRGNSAGANNRRNQMFRALSR